jgi:hypothetical protein
MFSNNKTPVCRKIRTGFAHWVKKELGVMQKNLMKTHMNETQSRMNVNPKKAPKSKVSMWV